MKRIDERDGGKLVFLFSYESRKRLEWGEYRILVIEVRFFYLFISRFVLGFRVF